MESTDILIFISFLYTNFFYFLIYINHVEEDTRETLLTNCHIFLIE